MTIYSASWWLWCLTLPLFLVTGFLIAVGQGVVAVVIGGGFCLTYFVLKCPRCGGGANAVKSRLTGFYRSAFVPQRHCARCGLDFTAHRIGSPADPSAPDTRVKYKDPTTGKEYY
jgi:hypothetical protein